MQLPVGKPIGDLVRPVQRQRCLAHPRGPADRGDHHRARRPGAGLVQDSGERLQFGGPAGEVRHRRGQLTWHHSRAVAAPGARAGCAVVLRASGQQLLDPLSGDLQRPGQLRPDPRRRRSLAALPAHHRGALDRQQLRQLFLRQAQRLAALGKLPPGRDLGYGMFCHDQDSVIPISQFPRPSYATYTRRSPLWRLVDKSAVDDLPDRRRARSSGQLACALLFRTGSAPSVMPTRSTFCPLGKSRKAARTPR
jgi:hypothetical protein